MQVEILLALDTPHMTAVGDDDQRIYSFRGALPRGFDHLRRAVAGAHAGRPAAAAGAVAERRLERNYRSSGNILEAAAWALRGGSGREGTRLTATAAAGEPVAVWELETERDEAWRVAEEVWRLRGAAGRGWGECAVLLRNMRLGRERPAEAFEEALLGRGIPFEVVRSVHLLDR